MANDLVPQGENKVSYIQNLFSNIAGSYDLLNDLMTFFLHKKWKRKCIESASPNIEYNNKVKVLDLCTGTGDMAFMWSENPKVIKAIGLDSCVPMLDVAEQKLNKENPDLKEKLYFMEGDALALPFQENYFDAITVGFGLRNVSNLDKSIEEIYRVLKPGGFIASLDLGHPESKSFYNFYKNVFLKLVPVLGAIFAGNQSAYDYLVNSLDYWPTQKELSQKFWDAGFSRSHYKNLMFGTIAIVIAQK